MVEVGWDTTSIVFNAGVDIINVGLLPVWNSAVYYILEPIVSLALEIFSIVFLRQSFPGVLPDDFGYTGVDCTASADAMAWCGRYDHYAKELESDENAPNYAAQSQSYKGMGDATAAARRALAIAAVSNETFVFGLTTARQLRALAAEDDVVIPAFRLGPLVAALDALSTFFLAIFPMLCDMFFAIAQEVLISSFSVIMDVIQIVLEQLMTTAKMLVKSGLLTTLMGVGVDFLVVMFTELALPMLFAAIDLLMCVLDLFAPSGWNDQLEYAIKKSNLSHASPIAATEIPVRPIRQVRRGDVLQGAQHHDRPARVHGRAHRAAPLHGHHGRDAQLAHRQALQQRLQDGRVHHQGPHHRRAHGHAHQQRGARDGERGQPRQRVLARRRLFRLPRHQRLRQLRQVLRVQGEFWPRPNPIVPHASHSATQQSTPLTPTRCPRCACSGCSRRASAASSRRAASTPSPAT